MFGGGGGGGGGGLVWVTHQARGSIANCAVLILRLIRDLFSFAPL